MESRGANAEGAYMCRENRKDLTDREKLLQEEEGKEEETGSSAAW